MKILTMKFSGTTQKIFFIVLVSVFTIPWGGGIGGFLSATGETVSRTIPLHFDFTPEEFETALKSGKPTFLDISATWCPPCHEAAPAIEDLKKVYGGQVNIMTVNYDKHKSMVSKYGVRMLPSFIFFNRKGEKSGLVAGFDNKENIEAALKKLLN